MQILNYINGTLQPAKNQQWLANIEPATGQVYSELPDSDASDVNDAITAAENAFDSWAKLPSEKRSAILLRIADLIDRDAEFLAQAESKDQGKPVKLAASVDIPRASANMRFFATAAMHFASESHHSADAINYTTRTPLGVVACISPWNLPL